MATRACQAELISAIEAEITRRDPVQKGRYVRFRCPYPERHQHGDIHPSADWDPEKAQWKCRVCIGGGGYVNLARALGIEFQSGRWEAQETVYDYRGADGVLRFQVVRRDFPDGSKTFPQRRPTGRGEWAWNLKGVEQIPYGLPELVAADPAELILVVEGEKAVHAARELEFVAISNPGGAGKWRDSYAAVLRDRKVAILPDNDEPGRQHGAQVAASCHQVAANVRVVELPDLPEKGDVADWIAAGHTAGELRALIEAADPWAPPPDGFVDGRENGSGAIFLARLPVRNMAAVQPEHVDFAWPKRIAFRKLNLIAGIQGEGKTTVVLDFAARMSRAADLPGGGMAPRGDTLLFTAEDGLADTIRPRLDRQGADVRHVHAVDIVELAGEGWAFNLTDHLPLLEQAVTEHHARHVVFDPIVAFTGRTDTHKAAEVRQMLAPLAHLAQRTGAAVVGLMHLNKRTGEPSPLFRVTAATDFTAAARSVLMVLSDPNEPRRKYLTPVKHNLSAPPEPLAFHFTDDGTLVWDGIADVDTAELLNALPETASKIEEAEAFLVEQLADAPCPAKEVQAAIRERGLAWRTVERAKERLGVTVRRVGEEGRRGGGRFEWALPADDLDRQPPRVCVGGLNPLSSAQTGAEAPKSVLAANSHTQAQKTPRQDRVEVD